MVRSLLMVCFRFSIETGMKGLTVRFVVRVLVFWLDLKRSLGLVLVRRVRVLNRSVSILAKLCF